MAGFNIKHWFADGAFRTIIRNSAWLGSSNVVSALLGLLALSCAGKGMTPAMFGVLVIVQSYAKSISDFIKFQTWQLVVQYGTPALTNNNPQQFRNVVSFSFSLDIVSGAVAIVGGIALLPFLSHSLGLDDQSFWLAALYCTLIPSMASSTPTGILRAVDRFDLIAVQQATKPFLRAAGSVAAWYFDFGFAGFVIAWYVSNLVGGTMYWWFAARELRRRNIHNAFKLNLFESARHIKGAWSFVWSTNIAHSIWSARNSCSTVLVGIVLLAWWMQRTDLTFSPALKKLMDQVRKKVTIRCINRQRFAEEMQILREIFNSGWQHNWGFVPFTEHEFATMGDQLKYLVPDDMIYIAEIDSAPCAFIVGLPNINEAIADLNGSLFPFGWAKLLWRLKVSGVRTARVPLMGVRDEYQFSRIGPVIALLLIEALRDPFARRKIDALEMSWILETNTGMNNMLERIGAEPYKRYRLYEKQI